ncbi:hypothetical protein OQA88_1815 [Cercophora sp. LCS_1]
MRGHGVDFWSPGDLRDATKLRHNVYRWRTLPASDLGRWWLEFVILYSDLELSHRDDTFPAISGLAKHFQSARIGNVEYLAGLWRDNLACGLLWWTRDCPGITTCGTRGCQFEELTPDPSDSPDRFDPLVWSRRRALFRQWKDAKLNLQVAPSWSWASVSGNKVNFFVKNSQHFTEMCEIIGAVTKPVGEDQTGQLVAGASYVTICSSLSAATLRIDKGGSWHGTVYGLDIFQKFRCFTLISNMFYFYHVMGGIELADIFDFHECFLHDIKDDPEKVRDWRASVEYLPGWQHRYDTDDFDTSDPFLRVYCLLMGRGPSANPRDRSVSEDENGYSLYFLVLRRVMAEGNPDTTDDKGSEYDKSYRYQRVGVAEVQLSLDNWRDEERELIGGEKRTVTIY